jgi:hypothetical protein
LSKAKIVAAKLDFNRLRNQAMVQELLAVLTHAPIDLLSFKEVQERLHLQGRTYRGLQDIPLDKIVGSVGRYRDFTRTFLPRKDADKERWAQVKALVEGMMGLSPIEVFQVGDVYFVKDGNHRVSVARGIGARTIQAHVTECKSRVPLDASTTPEDLIIKADYAHFLELTHLEELRPDQRIEFTAPERYQDLLTHIGAHRHYLEQQLGQPVPWEEAATGWYDNVYLPLVHLIREKGLLKGFPHRTEADLYAWVTRYEMELRQHHSVPDVDDEVAVEEFAGLYSARPVIAQLKAIHRALRKLFRCRRRPAMSDALTLETEDPLARQQIRDQVTRGIFLTDHYQEDIYEPY